MSCKKILAIDIGAGDDTAIGFAAGADGVETGQNEAFGTGAQQFADPLLVDFRYHGRASRNLS
ncbi:hypothetical protein GGI1_21654 [Acidithiobacillus sp. GGI-221]|nr:hypothetical protein GGI1_21654 [Acidithiobacillus sp. GGI-221]